MRSRSCTDSGWSYWRARPSWSSPQRPLHRKHHKKPAKKPATFETDTYNAKTPASPPTEAQKFSITLKKTTCAAAPGQGTSPLHLCVSVATSPRIGCTAPTVHGTSARELPDRCRAPLLGQAHRARAPPRRRPPILGSEPETGEAIFSVAFTKTGTASGYIEQNLTYAFGSATRPPVRQRQGAVHGQGGLSVSEAWADRRPPPDSASPSSRTPCSIAGSERLP